jgi:hypothetical protein
MSSSSIKKQCASILIAAIPNHRFEFQKRGQLFIRTHNEKLSAAMCVNDPEFVGFIAVYVGVA